MERKLTFFTDPGHGWLAVEKTELKKLGIADKVSSCSYMKGEIAYLEEDDDAGIFINALKQRDPDIEISIKESHDEVTPIRNYQSYKE